MVLDRRLRDALTLLNPSLPASALDEAVRKLTQPEGATLETRNRSFHRMLVNGVNVDYRAIDGAIRGRPGPGHRLRQAGQQRLAGGQPVHCQPRNRSTRRPDVVLFLNGLPLGVIELKNPADEDATIWTAWQQLQTYQAELPTLFSMNGAPDGFRRPECPHRRPGRGQRMVQALAHHHRGSLS